VGARRELYHSRDGHFPGLIAAQAPLYSTRKIELEITKVTEENISLPSSRTPFSGDGVAGTS